MSFRQVIESRGIEHLTHFTDIRNVESILSNGILSPLHLDNHKRARRSNNGDTRLSPQHNMSCFNITSPDWELYHTKKYKTEATDFVVLLVDPRIIEKKKTTFFTKNSLSGKYTSPEPKNNWGVWNFQKMFNGNRAGIADNVPTDKSAEIQIVDVIEPSFIQQIVFPNAAAASWLFKNLKDQKSLNGKSIWVGYDNFTRACHDHFILEPKSKS